MKSRIFIALSVVLSALFFSACDDDVSLIGSSLASGEVSIMVDSITTPIEASSVYYDTFDGRNTTKLLGRINVPAYGSLSCSFVSQMMSAIKMNIPDSIGVEHVDSIRLILSVPVGSLTGDSLAPQQLRVYQLEKQLPSDITSSFNPEGYYSSASLMGTKSYTLSNIARGDSAMKESSFVRIPIQLPLEFGRKIFNMYRASDPVFEWPATFNTFFPGIYVEQNFGNGCIANISKAEMFTYWSYTKQVYEKIDDENYGYVPHTMRDSICLMASQPEVLSSNIIDYKVSDYIRGLAESGKSIMTTPGGYLTEIKFPVGRLLDEFLSNSHALTVVSSLKFEIPAEAIENDHGLGVAPDLLMVRKSDYADFFAKNKVPDNVNSFYAAFDSESGCYKFNNLRAWFLQMLEDYKAGKEVAGELSEFVLVPVSVTTETVNGYTSTTTYVTRCQPYLEAPTMTRLLTDRCKICFTYSSQQIN